MIYNQHVSFLILMFVLKKIYTVHDYFNSLSVNIRDSLNKEIVIDQNSGVMHQLWGHVSVVLF